MASTVNITKVRFSIALLFVCLIASVLSVNVDEETKAFIRLVIENSNGDWTVQKSPYLMRHWNLLGVRVGPLRDKKTNKE